MSILSSPNNLLSKEELLLRLEEAEETLRAIRSGEVDALVVSGTQGDQVFTLKDATLPYQVLIEEMNEGALTLSLQGAILYCNSRFAEILGFPMETTLGESFLRFVIPSDQTRARELLVQRLEGKSRGELTLLGSQAEVPVGISLKEIKLDGELRLGVVISDLTERKQAEAELERHKENLERLVQERTTELEELNRELARSNENLEQFAYVASHDLQEPLRMVSSYMQLLSKRYQGKLDSDADEFIAFAVDGATRMQNLINDLLTYSRAGRHDSPLTSISCTEVLEKALTNLQVAIGESGAIITHERLPVVKADPIQLVLVFQNLLGNAIKFHGSAPPRIHIESQREGDEWIFSVRDNGIGLDPQFAERIFLIFQRLHDRSSYPGTGIGLAICKRIIQRHNGRIWVESQPGKGSTFYFTLLVRGTDST